MTAKFKYKHDGLTEDQIKELCLELKIPYKNGEYQQRKGYIQFKIWHHQQLNKRDGK